MRAITGIVALTGLLVLAGCGTKRETGAVVGAAGGAVVGSQVGDGGILGTAVGAALGGLAGHWIGDRLDERDRQELARTLEEGDEGETVRFEDEGEALEVTPGDRYLEDGKVHRRVTLETTDGEEIEAVAVKQDDGTWVLQGV